MACRHCGRSKVNRPRGLCWSCYYTPGVRERYPSTSKFAYRGNGTGNGAAPLPLEPTAARPGSPEKVAVLEERARRRQALWHPLDARMESESQRPHSSSLPTSSLPIAASPRPRVSASLNLPLPASPNLPLPVSPPLRVSVSPRLRVSESSKMVRSQGDKAPPRTLLLGVA